MLRPTNQETTDLEKIVCYTNRPKKERSQYAKGPRGEAPGKEQVKQGKQI